MTDNLQTIEPQVRATKPQRRADAARRALIAAELRIAGHTWAEVAQGAGFANEANAVRAVRRHFGALPTMGTDEQRKLWMLRLERLWSYADRDARKGKPGAIRAGVAVAQRAAALSGLDAPQRVSVDYDSDELDEIVRQIERAVGRGLVEPDVLVLEVLDEDEGGDDEALES